jgi:hypothetical protein
MFGMGAIVPPETEVARAPQSTLRLVLIAKISDLHISPIRMLRIELTVRLPRLQTDVARPKAHEAFAQELDDGLRSMGLGALHPWPEAPQSLAAVIEPPTRIGEALDLARTLLKKHKLKRGSELAFDEIQPGLKTSRPER